MCEEPMKKELAKAVRELFEARCGEFRIDDLIEVLKEFELTAIKRLPAHLRGRMYAKNYFPDIIGTNLEFALEEYEWEKCRPMTSNGITVTGFWDSSKESEIPQDYVVDESGRYLKHKSL